MSGFLHIGGGALTLACPSQAFPSPETKYAVIFFNYAFL
jgi:hypothetical protein